MNFEKYTVNLLTLPAELLHRICDFLDAETIALSFRHVCSLLLAVTETYNRYKIHSNSITKISICRIIPAKNVVSMDFRNGKNAVNWVELFITAFDINQYTRLRSLSIHTSNIKDLNVILHHAAINCNLRLFTLCSNILENSDDTWQFLPMIIAKSSLRNLQLNFDMSNKQKLSWPVRCMIMSLSLGTCTIKQFHAILQNSPHLHTVIMNNCQIIEIDETSPLYSFHQLNSLTFNDMHMTMNELEFFLSHLPSLTHLNLTSSAKPFTFVQRLSQWEQFIRLQLPRLKEFEFCIFCYCCDWENFDVLIARFRTPFWLEQKHWFVTCQFRDDWTSSFTIFTSPESLVQQYREGQSFDRVVCSRFN